MPRGTISSFNDRQPPGQPPKYKITHRGDHETTTMPAQCQLTCVCFLRVALRLAFPPPPYRHLLLYKYHFRLEEHVLVVKLLWGGCQLRL